MSLYPPFCSTFTDRSSLWHYFYQHSSFIHIVVAERSFEWIPVFFWSAEKKKNRLNITTIHDRSFDQNKYWVYKFSTQKNTSEPPVIYTASIPPPPPNPGVLVRTMFELGTLRDSIYRPNLIHNTNRKQLQHVFRKINAFLVKLSQWWLAESLVLYTAAIFLTNHARG